MTAVFDLSACRALLALSEGDVQQRLDVAHGETRQDVAYERIEGVTQYYNPERFPGRVYMRGGRVEMVYVPSGPALEGVPAAELARQLRGAPAEMRSRAGKEFTHCVYADQGVAYSAEDDELQFVEVFPPRTLQAYLDEVYEDPGPFIR